jgi:ClpX C4-type zinc finger
MPSCSFCGKAEDRVERLIQGGGKQPAATLPVVHICNECVALAAEIIGTLTPEPSYEQITAWAEVEDGGQTFRWSAARATVSTRDVEGNLSERWPMLMLSVGKPGKPAMGVMYPDGTEPTEALALEAIRQMLDRL